MIVGRRAPEGRAVVRVVCLLEESVEGCLLGCCGTADGRGFVDGGLHGGKCCRLTLLQSMG